MVFCKQHQTAEPSQGSPGDPGVSWHILTALQKWDLQSTQCRDSNTTVTLQRLCLRPLQNISCPRHQALHTRL